MPSNQNMEDNFSLKSWYSAKSSLPDSSASNVPVKHSHNIIGITIGSICLQHVVMSLKGRVEKFV